MARKVYGFGETVLDIIFKEGVPVAAKPGGSVLNALVSLGRLGWDPCFISEYGLDDVGNLTEHYLTDNGVNTSYVNRFTDGQSALALAFLDDDRNASYSFYKDFPEKRIQKLPNGIQRDDIILFGSIYASSAAVRNAVLRFLETGRQAGGLILYDPNFRKAHIGELAELRPRIEENMMYADIIRGSDEDFRLIFGITDPAEIPGRLKIGGRILICTRNRESVLVFAGGKQLEVPVTRISPLSTIGAGDNFNAGIVHHLLSAGLLREQLKDLDSRELEEMVTTGILFAENVCQSYDNYISREFASKLLS
jgi:fructokinase